MKAVSRYHPALVTLHWLIAVLIVVMLCVGYLVLDAMSNSDPAKIDILLIHMAVGMTILALMIVRLIVRARTAKPPPATAGNATLDRIGVAIHYGFYVVVVLMVGSGLATALITGLNRSVFQRNGEPLPASFEGYPTFFVHEKLATLLIIMIVLHGSAAIYHQFVRKDGLLRRMWFGNREG